MNSQEHLSYMQIQAQQEDSRSQSNTSEIIENTVDGVDIVIDLIDDLTGEQDTTNDISDAHPGNLESISENISVTDSNSIDLANDINADGDALSGIYDSLSSATEVAGDVLSVVGDVLGAVTDVFS